MDTWSQFHIKASFLNVSEDHDNENEALTPSSGKILSLSLAPTFIIIRSYGESLRGGSQGQVIFKQTGQGALWFVSIHLTRPQK